ncbi:MAG: hypothetical protein ACQESM_07925 [Bacteroidota bacterium]
MMKINKKIVTSVLLISIILVLFSCYDDFKGPAGYSNYYFDNQTSKELFLEYKLSQRHDEEVRLTSVIYPDSMVRFHDDKMTEQNPTPETSFQWLKIYEKVNDTTDALVIEINPMNDTLWTSEKVTDFEIGERNWILTFPFH